MYSQYRIIIYIIFVILSSFFLFSLDYYQYQDQYVYLLMCYEVTIMTYWIHIREEPFDFFHPCHLFYIFYICIFFYTPLLLIDAKNELCFGVNVMGGCIKATLIATLALISFTIGYVRNKPNNKIRTAVLANNISDDQKRKILKLSYGIYSISLCGSILYLIRSGRSFVSIILLGFASGHGFAESGAGDAMLFLINISYLMLAPWLFICIYEKNKILKIIISFLLFSIFFAYGWRFILYIMIIAYTVVYSRIKNRTFKLRTVSLLVGFLLLLSVFVGSVRNSVRTGQDIEFSGFTKEGITYTLKSNFDIYQTFYAIADYYPSKDTFYYGKACFVYPIIMWIPRTLWPDKPYMQDFPLGQAIMKAAPEAIEEGSMAFPNLVEYYIDFGLIGVLIFSYIIGVICKKMTTFYNSSSVFDIVLYALFLGFLIQFINRGYIAQLLTLFVFLFSPLLLYRKFFPRSS